MKNIGSLDFVVKNLRSMRQKYWQEVSIKTGIPESTISKVAYKVTKNPGTKTVEALFNYFSEK